MQKLFKKPVFLSIAIVTLTVLISSCKQQANTEETQPTTSSERITKPEKIVSLKNAQSMYSNYSERRVPIIQQYEDRLMEDKANQGNQEQDSFIVARYIHYDYQTIKDYLAYIEQEAADANVEISSLRFYLTNYPNKKEFENGKPILHPKQNSILILPAVTAGKSEYGLYLNELQNGEKVPVYLSDELVPMDSKEVGVLEERTKNYAGMAPTLNATHETSYNAMPFAGNISLFLNEGGSSPPKNQ